MCLACEWDALWYAEMERAASEGAGGTAAAPPAAAADRGDADAAGGARGEEEAAGPPGEDTRVAPAGGRGGTGTRPAAPRGRFFCEEAE